MGCRTDGGIHSPGLWQEYYDNILFPIERAGFKAVSQPQSCASGADPTLITCHCTVTVPDCILPEGTAAPVVSFIEITLIVKVVVPGDVA